MKKKLSTYALLIVLMCVLTFSYVHAISNGENAVDLLGQSVANDNVTNDYTDTGANDGAALYGLYTPDDATIDSVHHRLFISDKSNNRVLVFNLNASNQLVDRTPDFVLGQTSFFSDASAISQSGMNLPRGLAYDSVNDRLFVADSQSHRVLVFDTATIVNGQNAINVLGQTDFVSGAATVNQARMSTPVSLAYDSANSRLFVAQNTGNRVTVYDVASITNGENAVNVLGQSNFTALTGANTQSGMNQPRGLAYDAVNSRLFVSQGNNRVTVYNAAIGTLIPNGAGNGANATAVLGQSTYTATTAANTQAGMNQPQGLTYESANSRLFVAQSGNNRVTVYDVASITNGENAVNVLGQSTYTATTAANTQAGINSPQGLAYDSSNNRLFVVQSGNNRATVYNTAIATLIPNGAGNGANAIDVIGQSTADDGVTADYTTFGPNEGPKLYGLYDPNHIEIDLTHHRLFVSESTQGRVLVYDLNSSNQLVDKTPDFVLGQPDFYNIATATTQSGTSGPKGMAYDSGNDRLFVADFGNNRVLVFDTATIVNGENAVNVLGQSLFTTSAAANTQAGMSGPIDLVLDSTNNRLFVEQTGNNRVTVYNVAIGSLIPNNAGSNGPNATAVLGQANYTATAAANTQAGLNVPQGIAYDSANQRLFVAQTGNNRVSVFDVNSITNGENAINVLGQATFTSTASVFSQSGMSFPRGLAYDSSTKRLFVSQASSNRVTVYNVDPATLIANTPATDGPNAINVLGQADYTSSAATNSQAGLNLPFDMVYDSSNNLLYVVEVSGNRVKIFNANDKPVLGTISGSPDPVTVGSNITFSSGNWTDSNSADTQKLFVCKTNSLTSSSTGGCADGSWYEGSSYTASNPQTGTYTALNADIATSPNNYYVFICDSSQETNSCSASSSGTFTVQGGITAGSSGTQTAALTIPSTSQYVGGAFTFIRASGTANITQIVLSEKGTVNANTNLSNVKLFYKQEATCSASIPAGTTAFNAVGVGFDASDQATVTGTIAVGTSQICVYAQMDVGIGTVDGHTFELEISNPSTDVTVSTGTVSPATAVAISGTTTLNGTLTVDIVDGSANSVSSPSVTFSALGFGFSSQNSTGTLGAAAQKIRVLNTRSTVTWTMSIAATSGSTALWDGGTFKYDYNDHSGTSDGSDSDSYGGQLTLDPNVGTLAAVAPCASTTGITKGSSAAYSETAPVISSISILSAGGSASTNCKWDFTGASLSQAVPGSQPAGTYTISFTITVV